MTSFSDGLKQIKPYILSWITDHIWWNASSTAYALTIKDGRAICIRGKLAADVVQGQIIKPGLVSGTWISTIADDDMPNGIAHEAGVTGQYIWITIAGIDYVLFEAGVTGTAGYVVFVSGTAGQADNSATLPSIAEHNREIGHCVETGTSGGLALCNLHWN